ncbi:MAG: putative toxin-antitoxin system toxin component, PIN family [Bryobacterales bacterium]|nr:putative toxin-antitoxin system toxin component, PIN family [Bryobacterales bacterium]
MLHSLWLAGSGEIRIDLSDSILDETIRVLRERFGWNGYMLQSARNKLLSVSYHVSPGMKLFVFKEDPEDNHVLECALEARSNFIVTEDKDLLRLREFADSRIVTIAEFLTHIAALRK